MKILIQIATFALFPFFFSMNGVAFSQNVVETSSGKSLETSEQEVVSPTGSYATHLETYGGIEKLQDLSQWRLVFTTKMREDQNNLTIKVTACRNQDKIALMIENNQLDKPIYVGTNGKEYWIDSPVDESVGGGRRLIDSGEFERHFLDVALLLPNFGHLDPLPFEITGTEEIEKQEHDLIKFNLTANQTVIGLVNKSTGRLSSIRYTQKHQFGETDFESSYSDFNDAGEITSIANQQVRATKGAISFEFETTIEQFDVKPKFDDKLFTPPKEIRTLLK